MTLSIATNYHYAECRDLFIVMLSVNMLSVVMLNVSMLSGMPPYYQVDIDSANNSRVDKVSFCYIDF
jgi:hypothetical protein